MNLILVPPEKIRVIPETPIWVPGPSVQDRGGTVNEYLHIYSIGIPQALTLNPTYSLLATSSYEAPGWDWRLDETTTTPTPRNSYWGYIGKMENKKWKQLFRFSVSGFRVWVIGFRVAGCQKT